MNSDFATIAVEYTKEILNKCGINAEVSSATQDDTITVQIETDDPGIIIGSRGRTITSLQTILSQMIHNARSEWIHVLVDVGDWRTRREEQLRDLAYDLAQEAIETGRQVQAPPLSSFERRIVHLALADHPEVVSESTGVGRDRRLIIRNKS